MVRAARVLPPPDQIEQVMDDTRALIREKLGDDAAGHLGCQ